MNGRAILGPNGQLIRWIGPAEPVRRPLGFEHVDVRRDQRRTLTTNGSNDHATKQRDSYEAR